MLKIIDLHKSFALKPVLNGVNLEVAQGETFALIGPSGNGKSVLLKHMIGLLEPDQGSVLVDGEDVHRLHGTKLKAMKDRFGIVFQFGALFDSLTVYENVAFPLQEKTKLDEKAIDAKVMDELKTVGLESDGDKYPAQISGGMRKRVAVARALITDPDIILFDEPTTGLDPIIANQIYHIIQKLQKERNLTSFIISHEIPGIFKIVNRAAMLHDGAIIQAGTSEEIQNSENPIVQKFLQGEIE